MRRHLSSVVATLACTTLAACAGDSAAPRAGSPLSVSFTAAATATVAASRAATVVSGADVLTIASAELVLSRVELQRVGAACAGTEAAGDDDAHARDSECAELELAPSVVSLPVNGTVTSALTVDVPAGSYSAFEAKIRPVDANRHHGSGASAFLAAHPDLAGASVRVTGTYNGTAFTWVGAPDAALERTFSPALVVDGSASWSVNLTVQVDVASWFRNSSGALVNPSTANAGGANAGLVSDNVRRSFRAFRDDDRDGRDDRGNDGANHG